MKILAIETSCDDTAIAILEVKNGKFKVLGEAVDSQTKIHEQYGGVFPMKAKIAHAQNLVPALLKVLEKNPKSETLNPKQIQISKIRKILEREPGLFEQMEKNLFQIKRPKIDRIAVTYGPGLEPALWVGINFAKALSILWGIPVVPVNHMRGHFLASLAEGKSIKFPALGLLISGGHTLLAVAKSACSYKLLGQTRDDACGEAYDKVARILGLPYPGGPHIAALAAEGRKLKVESRKEFRLPRPMINSKNLDFSFAGLKTAVLYLTRKIGKINNKTKLIIAQEFEEAVKDVLVSKTEKAVQMNKVKALVIGGGVSANTYIMKNLKNLVQKFDVKFLGSSRALATDNAVMIGVAGFFAPPAPLSKIKAVGNLSINK